MYHITCMSIISPKLRNQILNHIWNIFIRSWSVSACEDSDQGRHLCILDSLTCKASQCFVQRFYQYRDNIGDSLSGFLQSKTVYFNGENMFAGSIFVSLQSRIQLKIEKKKQCSQTYSYIPLDFCALSSTLSHLFWKEKIVLQGSNSYPIDKAAKNILIWLLSLSVYSLSLKHVQQIKELARLIYSVSYAQDSWFFAGRST